jgi:hypothetical protein
MRLRGLAAIAASKVGPRSIGAFLLLRIPDSCYVQALHDIPAAGDSRQQQHHRRIRQ